MAFNCRSLECYKERTRAAARRPNSGGTGCCSEEETLPSSRLKVAVRSRRGSGSWRGEGTQKAGTAGGKAALAGSRAEWKPDPSGVSAGVGARGSRRRGARPVTLGPSQGLAGWPLRIRCCGSKEGAGEGGRGRTGRQYIY